MYNEEQKETKSFNFFANLFRKRTRRLLTNIDRLFSKIMWIEIILSCVIVFLGVIFMLYPGISLTVIAVLFGVFMITSGAFLIYAFIKRDEISLFKFNLIYGVVAIVLGIITVIAPFTFTQLVTIFIGIWLLYRAIINIKFGIDLKKMDESSWLVILVSGVLEIFMSILIFVNPFSNMLLAEIAGAYMILYGILNCATAVLTKNRAIDFLENL